MNAFTKKDLMEMWERPPERQYMIATSKMLEAIRDTEGNIAICFSGGKDSSLLLDMYCEVVKMTEYAEKPIDVHFANTTNETSALLSFVGEFIPYIQQKHGVTINFTEVKPPNGLTWAKFVLENGIPLISKMQSKAIRTIKADMASTRCDYETVRRLASPDIKCVNELFEIGFSKTGVLALTGYVSKNKTFGKLFTASKKWLPMANCAIDITEQCCVKIKEAALDSLGRQRGTMTGEQAAESTSREAAYLKTGCNAMVQGGFTSQSL